MLVPWRVRHIPGKIEKAKTMRTFEKRLNRAPKRKEVYSFPMLISSWDEI